VNIFFDVDHTLLLNTKDYSALRPGAHISMQTLSELGNEVHVWSAGGKNYCQRIVEQHGLSNWVTDCHDKSPKVQPKPDVIIDDDHYLVEKYGGYTVSQYKKIDENDRELLEITEQLIRDGR
ncbi:uncharacterized protein METZ01_LOCUS452705, partial [marine metagenome]